MPGGLPLSSLLSQTLAAFTIECDNEFEHRMPHRTTNHGSTSPSGVWLVSMAMWWNCMRFVGEEGIRAADLEKRAGMQTNLAGMRRWGYVVLRPDPAAPRAQSSPRHFLICPTPQGRQAQDVWRPLCGIVEKRWRERFGESDIARLRASLLEIVRLLPIELPDFLPILNYGLFTRGRASARRLQSGEKPIVDPELPLPALLAKLLLACALQYEKESELSLAIAANVLRVLHRDGVRLRDLPARSGVSREALAMAMGILRKADIAIVESAARGAAKVVLPTPQGLREQRQYDSRSAAIDEMWQSRLGIEKVRTLRQVLESLVGTPGASPILKTLKPYPDGWRAQVSPPVTLPHYPMVLHRGGFPDGS